MPADFLEIDASSPPGRQVVRLASILQEARNICSNIMSVGAHTINATDYTQLERVFGLKTGDGDDLTTLVTALNTALNTATDMTGTARKAALDDFIGRVAMQ